MITKYLPRFLKSIQVHAVPKIIQEPTVFKTLIEILLGKKYKNNFIELIQFGTQLQRTTSVDFFGIR